MENVPLSLRNFLVRLFPKPNLTFYLTNNSKVLHQRRPEESIVGLERQLKLFKRLSTYMDPIVINTNDKSKNINQIKEKITAYLLHNWY